MPVFIAQKVMKMLVKGGHMNPSAKVGILGLAFKENVRDLRNSRVPEIVAELQGFGVEVLVYDPVVDKDHARHEYGLDLCNREDLEDLDAMIVAVSHQAILDDLKALLGKVQKNGIVVDIKSVMKPSDVPAGMTYWSL